MRGAVGFIGLFGFVLFSFWGIYSLVKKDYKILFQAVGLIISICFFLTAVYFIKPVSDKGEEVIAEVDVEDRTQEVVATPADVAPTQNKNSEDVKQSGEGDKGEVINVVIKEGPPITSDTYNVNRKYGVANGRLIEGRMTQIEGRDDLYVGNDHIFYMWNGRKDSSGITIYEEAEWSQVGDLVSLSIVNTKYGPELHVEGLKQGMGKIIAKFKGYEFQMDFKVSNKGIELKPELAGEYKDKGKIVISPQKDQYFENDVITITVDAQEGYDFHYSMRSMGNDYTYPLVGKAKEFTRLPIYIGPSRAPFEDKNFEQAVRDKLNKPSGPVMLQDLRGITSLDCSSRGITSFKGIEFAFKLRELNAENSNIYELTSLRENHNLTKLNLNNSGVHSLNGIHELKNLKTLILTNNSFWRIDDLKDLRNLETLYLKGSPVEDYSPAKGFYERLVNKDFEI